MAVNQGDSNPIIVQAGRSFGIGVLINDSDTDGIIDQATLSPCNGSRGSTALIAEPVFDSPNAGALGFDQVSCTVDGNLGATSDAATAFVDINDAPFPSI